MRLVTLRADDFMHPVPHLVTDRTAGIIDDDPVDELVASEN